MSSRHNYWLSGDWFTLSTRVRFALVLLMVMLVVVAGFSMRTAKAAPQEDVTLSSRQYDGSTSNLGQMYLDGQGPYNLPYNTRVSPGVHKIRFIPPAGFYWVMTEVKLETGETIYLPSSGYEETAWPSTTDPTITAIYQKIGLPAYVGGVVLPTNAYAIFAPYLAVIGLIGTAVVSVKKRKS